MDNKKQYIRKGQEVTFSAKLKKGDGSLTSWIVYEGNQCDDDHIVKEEKQVGTEFTFTFEKVGEYTIISYGKREEIKKKTKCIDNKSSISSKTNNEGKEEILVNELDSNCAFRLEVIENTIINIDCEGNKIRNAVRRSTDNWELKKGTSVTFKANFYIEKPTEEELSSLKMFVLDSNKNILVAQEGNNNISFIPENDNGTYTISAEHITSSGDKVTKEIIGKCILNNVISIKPDKPGELFRPNEEIIFKVDRMKFSADLEDTSRIKWYLNTILKQEGGETFKFSSDKKGVYFVEATNLEPNSSAKPDEKDTWKLTITDNEVKSISVKGMPKVRRPFELNAKTTFPNLTLEEIQKIEWKIPFNCEEKGLNVNVSVIKPFLYTQIVEDGPRTIKITPLEAGTFKVSCRINSEIVEKNIEIVQPEISSPHWIDKDGSSGNILEKAGYYQEMYAYAKHIGLDEEEVILEVYDVTNKQKPIYTSQKVVVPKGSKEICIPYTIKKTYKGKTEEEKKKEDRERKDIQIFFKIKAADTNFLIVSPDKEFENNLLTITNRGDIVNAYFCNSDDSQWYRFVKLNTEIYLKLYVANMIGKEVEVFFYDQYGFSLSDLSQNFNWKSWDSIAPRVQGKKAFYSDKKVIDNKGELLVKLDTSKFKKAQNHIHITAVFKTKVNDKEKGAYMNLANHLVLYYEKKLNDIVENVSAIKVAKGKVERVALEKKHKTCYCNRDFTVEEVKSLVKTINGTDKIWDFKNCDVDDKSYERLTLELNNMFRKYGINECIQKIAFLAMTSVETGFFRTAGEIAGNTASSQYYYKGRGLLQLTGDGSSPVMYEEYQKELDGKFDVVKNPNLVARNIHLVVDSGGFVWKKKTVPTWAHPKKKRNETQTDYEKRVDAYKWKREKFKKGLGKNLNEVALLMKEDEETYFFLIARILQGYLPKSKDDYPKELHYDERKANLEKLKKWFKYDKNVCNEVDESDLKGIMPPWMKVAWEEYEKYKGKHNKQSPLKERIYEYFDNSNYKAGTNETSWCAAFVTWCLNKSSPFYEEPKGDGDVKARAFTPKGKYKEYYWEKAKVTNDNKPAYGAIAMIRWDTGGEHVAFVIGKTKTGRIALLGGNQSIKENGVKIGSGITKSSAKESEIKFYMYPDNFLENSKLYNLTEEDITEKLTYTDTHL